MLLPTYAFYISLLSIFSHAMASPVDTLSSIQCNCITFYPYSQPLACTQSHSQNLSWSAAQSFASSHNLDITFTTQMAISRVLEVQQPLPTSVLMRMYGGRGRGRMRQDPGSRIMCGNYDEVKKTYLDEGAEHKVATFEARQCDGLVSEIVGILLLMLVLYALGDYIRLRFFAKHGPVQLEGAEKCLLARAEAGSISHPELNEKDQQIEATTQTESS
ncbi:hypothetical protein P280DRAFT_467218 [Massarina eburnea CBS 473.64]|uniref:Uncharacterized protein n=1 Tax=Massarina eburnea CBS 473.64 TaxID=1395130 RepID=A0A6A6S698_9PLEO|nr:hypothetical protein P280DRAFT_467218 [Massarina eburnea CBS 473.64]